jgi:mycothiol synthase
MDGAHLDRLERLLGATTAHPTGARLVYRLAAETRVWPDQADELAGAAALFGGHLQFDVRPDAWDTVAPEVLGWAISRAAATGVAALSTRAAEDDPRRVALLENAGFAREERFALRFGRRLDDPVPAPAPPPGFALRAVGGEEELPAYVALFHEACGDGPTVEGRRRVWRDRSYLRELDLVAVAPDGALAAFCFCTLPHNAPAVGWVEQMGTRPGLRRRGLGRALLREALARLAARGAGAVGLETGFDNPARHLYAAEGFVLESRVFRLRSAMDR